jgi:Zn-finger nucleic acid-binding protein
MKRYRLICPECGAVIVTGYPESALWELCPSCKRHVWDDYDAMMADLITVDQRSRAAKNGIAFN